MSRIVTLTDVEIKRVTITRIEEANVYKGFSLGVDYTVTDETGADILGKSFYKYSSGTSFPEEEKLNAQNEAVISGLISTIKTAMFNIEGL